MDADTLLTGDLVTRKVVVQLQPKGSPHPALLGMDVLGSHRCCFHFDSPGIELDQAPQPHAEWFSLCSNPRSTPTLAVNWGDVTSTATWDTGAGVTLVDLSWAETHPTLVTVDVALGRGTDVTGTVISHRWGTLAECRIGGRVFGEQVCAVVDLASLNATLASPIEVALGLATITQASWYMDFPSGRWALLP